jgi:hypothetical protein
MAYRPRARILANLESIYREAYERAKGAGDQARMADLDAAYQREQLLLEVLLDVRDALGALPAQPEGRQGKGPPDNNPGPDPITALETIRRITKLR